MKPEAAYGIASASLANACEFEEEATLSLERGRFGRACSLAILGQEEAGKAIYFFQVAIGTQQLKPDAVKVLFRRHVPKQQLGQALGVGETFSSWGTMTTALRASMRTFIDSEESVLESVSPAQIEALLRQSLDDFERAAGSDPADEDEFVSAMRDSVSELEGLDLDRLKQSGLYVDYDESTGIISTPNLIDSATAKTRLECLRAVVAMLRPMLNAVPAEAVDGWRAVLLPLLAEAAARGKAARSKSLKPEGERPPPG